MSAHEQYVEDLSLYALDALQGEERARLEQHLAGCAACRLELEQLRGDTALLALSAAWSEASAAGAAEAIGCGGAGAPASGCCADRSATQLVGVAGLGGYGGGCDICALSMEREFRVEADSGFG